MATLLSKLDSSYRPESSLSAHPMHAIPGSLVRPGMRPATVRLGLVLLGALAVGVAALLSFFRLILG